MTQVVSRMPRFSAEMFSAEMFSAEIFSAEMFSAEMFSAEMFSAEMFSAEIFRGLLTITDPVDDPALGRPPMALKVIPFVEVPSETCTKIGAVVVAYTTRVVLENGLSVTTPTPGPPFATGLVFEKDPVEVVVPGGSMVNVTVFGACVLFQTSKGNVRNGPSPGDGVVLAVTGAVSSRPKLTLASIKSVLRDPPTSQAGRPPTPG